MRRKKERSKQGQTNKQGKATQHTMYINPIGTIDEDAGQTGDGEALQQSHQLHGQPGSRHKVVGIVMEVGVAGCHNLREWRWGGRGRGEGGERGGRERGEGGRVGGRERGEGGEREGGEGGERGR